MTKSTRSLSPAVNRAATILEVLAAQQTPIGTSEIARRINAPKSTSSNILDALTQTELVERVGSDYVLGDKLVDLAAGRVSRRQLETRFAAFCEATEVGAGSGKVSLVLMYLEGSQAVQVARHPDHSSMHISMSIDERGREQIPAVACAPGLAMLAEVSPSRLDELLASASPMPRLTERSYRTDEQVRASLGRTKERGYAIDNELQSPGVLAFARALDRPVDGWLYSVGVWVSRRQVAEDSTLGVQIRARIDKVVAGLEPFLDPAEI